MLPEVSSNLKMLKVSSKAFRITQETLKVVQRKFSQRDTQLEIEFKYLVDNGESIAEEKGESKKRTVISKWKQNSLFKFFNSWRNYRDKCALKAFKTWTREVGERLEWKDINSNYPSKVKSVSSKFVPLR